MEKYYYSYEEFRDDMKELHNKCKEFEPEGILAIARGGLTMGHFMGMAFDMRNVYSLNSIHYEGEIKLDSFNIFNIPDLSSLKKVLILDDIIDSGETMSEILKILNDKFPNTEFRTGTIFYKKEALVKANYSLKEAKEWIDFFWEVDIK